MNNFRKWYILFCVSILVNHAYSQPGAMDGTFNVADPGFGLGDGAISNVQASAIQSDGKIVIDGAFVAYNGTFRSRVARLNTDGTLDNTFDPGLGASANVNAVAIQSDGKIIIVGDFALYNGTARSRIARLNSNGSLDLSFNPGTGAGGNISSVAIQSDGKILIGAHSLLITEQGEFVLLV